MAEDDIYGSKERYEHFKNNLESLLFMPQDNRKRKYICKNRINLEYFKKLFIHFESKDLSYIRRLRILQSMRFICHWIAKDLSNCDREDINKLMSSMHSTYNSPKSKTTFIKDIKYIWKILFPELDEKGRPDDTLVPYTVRHLSGKIDKSREKLRSDKITFEEFERIVNYFSNDPRIQSYLTISFESLARPQELLYVKLKNLEIYDNYAKIMISEHGKEGIGLLQCIDSFPYLIKWLQIHPFADDKESYLFINIIGYRKHQRQLKPENINKMLRIACEKLNINKPITCYSLKRNGVTMRRLRGESDMEIQHAARWTSTKQLKTYDLSNQDEAFKLALERRGIIKSGTTDVLKTKSCPFCGETVGFGEKICPKCRHILDKNEVLGQKNKDEEILHLRQSLSNMNNQIDIVKAQVLKELMDEISKNKKAFLPGI